MRLTYFGFHAVFLLPALAVLAVGLSHSRRRLDATHWVGTALITVVALLYTTPWDNHLISRGVWGYGDGVVALRVWLVPVEELLFMLLQPLVVALWLYALALAVRSASVTTRDRLLGVAAGALVGAVGLVLYVFGGQTYYLGAILTWAAPVLALQWGFGWPYLWAVRRTFAFGVAVPTVYFCLADRVALQFGIWHISADHTTGIALFGLPIEEATFFFVTNLFVVQGLLLFHWVVERWR